MITTSQLGKALKASNKGDTSLGNAMFRIASVIGIAEKNGYEYGFPHWIQQEYFVNPLPKFLGNLKRYKITPTYGGFDFGFNGFGIPDNVNINGELASYKYFEHCEDIIRHYFKLKDICKPAVDYVILHYRDYKGQGYDGWYDLKDYYHKALKLLPNKPILVVTDNIEAAHKAIGINCDYTSNSPIVDFYLLCNAEYLVMGNSTFSWWGAYLSKAVTVAPLDWFVNKDIKLKDFYLPNFILI
jgi:hypothetical protein